ncbi:MAG: DUF1846 domain-containing protein [Anaerolineae bacterium]|nr:DUF1846 domain-containing protein [Anaerolineae bacterium]
MPIRIGFDNQKYLREQTAAILSHVQGYSKLYLEFGGKLVHDYHASRVLPGYHPNVKMQLLSQLKDDVDVILCIYAEDIERRKVRGDFGITYDSDALRMIDALAEWDVNVRAVVITRYENQPAATAFKHKLERRGVQVYTHRYTKGYPTDIDTVVSSEGYGANEYIETQRPIVVVTGPGPGSGKLATCLSQLYHEYRRGREASYAKFETFPIWNLPLKHEVNVAYEAATADLRDVNMIDHFHLEAYNERTVNYNRDIEAFPLLRRILERITGAPSIYRSPTDMGVNCAGFGIIDDAAVREAARQEVIRRYFRYACEYAMGLTDRGTVQRLELLMDDLGLAPEDRRVVLPARRKAAQYMTEGQDGEGIVTCAAIELRDGALITGRASPLMHAPASMILNAAKHLAGIPDAMHLLSPHILESVTHFKRDILNGRSLSLDLGEMLIALGISAAINPSADLASRKLRELHGCEVHITHIPTPGDAEALRQLGLHVTSDPEFSSKSLYVS